jgi:putative ABC transport system permease protein
MKYFAQLFHVGENTRMAMQTLRQHKTRSALTVFGVVIAVVVLILVFSVMYGVDNDMRAYLEDFGTDTLFVFKFEPGIHMGNLSQEERTRKPLTFDDAVAVEDEAPSVKKVCVEAVPWDFNGFSNFQPTAKFNGKEVYNIGFEGTTTSYETVQNAHMAFGRFFSDVENEHREDVTVVGFDLAETLFPGHDAVGKTLQVDTMNFTIVGVLEKRKGTFLRDETADKEVLIPIDTYRKRRPQDKENFLTALAYAGKKDQATDEITGILRRRRHDAYNAKNSFGVSSAEAITDQFRSIMSSVALLTIAVASVGLLVGGVGVMNIMLMSVTERTHEIGIRKAIGARRGDVVRQFLIEAVVLTGSGGVVGVLIALGLIFLVNVLLPNVPAAVPLWSIGAAVLAAMSVGLFFGIYPAVKASGLDPVEALYE